MSWTKLRSHDKYCRMELYLDRTDCTCDDNDDVVRCVHCAIAGTMNEISDILYFMAKELDENGIPVPEWKKVE